MEQISKHTEFIPPMTPTLENKLSKSKTIKVLDSSNAKRVLSANVFDDLGKPKKPLSVYNLFYQEERKRILEERGYVPKIEVVERQETLTHHAISSNYHEKDAKKKRGRPRGKNYKKKSPHRIIGFEELTKCISKRWKFKKNEYCKLYGSIVEEKRRRYKQEMLVFNKKKKICLENETSRVKINSEAKFVCKNVVEECYYDSLHERDCNTNSDHHPEIEPLNIFDEYGVLCECSALDFEKCAEVFQNHHHCNEHFSFTEYNSMRMDQHHKSKKNDPPCLDFEQDQRIEPKSSTQPKTLMNKEQYPICLYPYINSEPYRMDEQPRHNHDMAHYQAEHHNVYPSYNCNSYHERSSSFTHGMLDSTMTSNNNNEGDFAYNFNESDKPNQVLQLNQHSTDVSRNYYQCHYHYSSSF